MEVVYLFNLYIYIFKLIIKIKDNQLAGNWLFYCLAAVILMFSIVCIIKLVNDNNLINNNGDKLSIQ